MHFYLIDLLNGRTNLETVVGQGILARISDAFLTW